MAAAADLHGEEAHGALMAGGAWLWIRILPDVRMREEGNRACQGREGKGRGEEQIGEE